MTSQQQLAVLSAMKIEVYRRRSRAPAGTSPEAAAEQAKTPALAEQAPGLAAAPAPRAPAAAQPVAGRVADAAPAEAPLPSVEAMDWAALEAAVAHCERCTLSASRTRTVCGAGHRQARLMLIGEAPGRDEDLQGEPFVGRAGQLLDQMLRAIGLRRDAVFITNILKCRPPGNRDPKPEEIACCRGYLMRQIALVQPALLLAVGRICAQTLRGTQQSIGRLRGAWHTMPETGLPLLVTYHPAYLLRQPSEKRKSWEDLKRVRARLHSVSDQASAAQPE